MIESTDCETMTFANMSVLNAVQMEVVVGRVDDANEAKKN